MFRTIADAVASLRAGTTTAAELTARSLAAITAHNPRTNAFISVDEAGARRAADEADRERARGVDRGPLHGVPLSIKDLIDVAGQVTTAASRVLDDRVAPVDAPVVTRLRAAGAVIIGRANLHEFALGTTSEDSAFGPVRHPLDAERSAGGSSGGSAAAVATGMGLASIGTDTGGSIRIPSAACGLVGLKPSTGEVPNDGVIPLSVTLDHVGPLAHTVQDAAWLHAVLAGREPSVVVAPHAGALRLRRLVGYFDAPIDTEVRAAFDAALERLAAAGATVLRGEIDESAVIAGTYTHIVLAEAAHWHAPYLDARADRYTPRVRARLAAGREISAVAYLEALAACRRLRAHVDAALDGCDALVLPTLPILAPKLGAEEVAIGPAGDRVPIRAAMLKHTQPFNLSGHPAITLPLPTGPLPVGLQLVGRLGRTEDLLAIAAACERHLSARA